jgi:hypothetical protein
MFASFHSNTTGNTSGVGTAYPSRAPGFTLVFSRVLISGFLIFYGHLTVILVDDVYIMLRLLLVVDFLFHSKVYLINKYTLYHWFHAFFPKRRKSI